MPLPNPQHVYEAIIIFQEKKRMKCIVLKDKINVKKERKKGYYQLN